MSDIVPDLNEESFPHVLIGDVTSAMADFESTNVPRIRRSCVRCIFASIEGLIAIAIDSVACLPLSPAELAAIRECTYEIQDNGSIAERARFVPLDRKLKAMVKLTKRVRPGYSLDLNHPGWSALLDALELRHRLTHPKALCDLAVSDVEVRCAFRGYCWFLAFVLQIVSETNEFLKTPYAALPVEVRQIIEANIARKARA